MDSRYHANYKSPVFNGFSQKRKFAHHNNNNGYHNNNRFKKHCGGPSSHHPNSFNSNNRPSKNGGGDHQPNNGNGPIQRTFQIKQEAQMSLQDQRRSLPVFQVREKLMQAISEHPTIIIIGETGSGKTTQIPQFLHDDGYTKTGMIAITQPRRVAAITLSKRVAQEANVQLGELVGYTVRFEDMTTPRTKIRYLTDGSLLREALADRLLKRYSVIVLDEAHERTINTDVLFGIIKEAQRTRSERQLSALKVIVMSATMDVDHFSAYFNKCEIIYLAGRAHPVKVFHAKTSQPDYSHACLSTLFEIHRTAPANHDVLIFLTGQEEIEHMAKEIRLLAKTPEMQKPTILVYTLYSQQVHQKQLEVFQNSAPGTRKVVLCTNIAETSLTIKGIKFVIDSGVVKRMHYNSLTGMDTLKVVKTAQDQAWQRTGRAGRDSPGQCYRTYTMAEYEAMSASTVPEILRSNIVATVLQLSAIGIDCKSFDFLDKPSDITIEDAMQQLHDLGATQSATSSNLTDLGRKMARFPLNPRFSKILLAAPEYGCLAEALTIVAILSGENIYYESHDPEQKQRALLAHAKFESTHGDHLTMLNVYRAFTKSEREKVWCHENSLNFRNLNYARDVRSQLSDICEQLGLEMGSCQDDVDRVRQCLITGLFNNIAHLSTDNHSYKTAAGRLKVKVHPSSKLRSKPTTVLFTELLMTGQCYMRYVTAIEADWVEASKMPNSGQLKKFRAEVQ